MRTVRKYLQLLLSSFGDATAQYTLDIEHNLIIEHKHYLINPSLERRGSMHP
jgi:hypothetical protein